jgi:hypothetical protein
MIALLALVMFLTPVAAQAPAPLITSYADVDLRFDKGVVTVQRIRAGRFAKPTALPRFRGRFSAIVAKSKQNLAEVAFDFPLLQSAESDDATPEARALAERVRKGVTSTTTVRVPWPDNADTLLIYDASTQKAVTVPLKVSAPPKPGGR